MPESDAGELAYAIVSRAKSCGVALRIVDGDLRYSGRSRDLSDDLRSLLNQNKALLVSALSRPVFIDRPLQAEFPVLRFHAPLWEKIVSGAYGVEFSNCTHWAGRTRGRLDHKRLRDAVDVLVQRHPVLGSRVVRGVSGTVFCPGQRVSLHCEDVATTRDPDVAGVALAKMVWRPFDTELEPLFRIFLIKLADDDFILGFVAHHFIADARSVRLLVAELGRAYAGEDPRPRPFQYADYVTACNEWLEGPGLPYRLAYWRRQLLDLCESRLPVDRQISLDQECPAGTLSFHLDTRLVSDLSDLARRLHSALFAVLFAANAIALAVCTGRSDIVVLMMHHGRDDARIVEMVGSTQNQLPIRLRLDSDRTFAKVVLDVITTCVTAKEFCVPWGYVRASLTGMGAPDAFNEFNFIDVPRASDRPRVDRAADQTVEHSWQRAHSSTPRHLPAPQLTLVAAATEIRGIIRYLTVQYEDATIKRYFEVFRAILERAAKSPSTTLAELAGLSGEARIATPRTGSRSK